MVLAISKDGVIGDRGKLPWCIPADMRHFRDVTMGHAMIMGRKTHESIGKALPGRRNIIISQTQTFYPGCEIAKTPADAVAMALETDPEARVVGGAQIYKELWPLARQVWLTEIHQTYPTADTRFDFPRDVWNEVSRRKTVDADYVLLERI